MIINRLSAGVSFLSSLAVLRGAVSAALPMVGSVYLFYYLLPNMLLKVSAEQLLLMTVFVSIVGLVNNNTFGLNQFLIYGLARKTLPIRYIYYSSIFLVLATLLLTTFVTSLLEAESLLPFYLLLCLISLSNILRAIFESQSRFFWSLLCKISFNALMCIVIVVSYDRGWSLILISALYVVVFGIYLVVALHKLNITVISSNSLSLQKYIGFFMVFLLITIFFYFDRFVILVLEPQKFAGYVMQFEQLIKLALPVNLGIMFIFPSLSAESSLAKGLLKADFIAFFCFILVYILISPYIYNALIDFSVSDNNFLKAGDFEIYVSIASIATFLVCLQITGIYSKNNGLFFFLVLLPNIITAFIIVFLSITLTFGLLFKSIVLLVSCLALVIWSEKGRSEVQK
jgi:hypothetical protein